MAKVISVFGATGKQGGAVVRNLLQSNQWQVRAITRDPSKEAAKALEKLGAKVVKGKTVVKISWNS